LLIVVDNDNDDNGDKKPSAVERRREENLSSLLEQVDIAGIKINKMALPHHVYAWKEMRKTTPTFDSHEPPVISSFLGRLLSSKWKVRLVVHRMMTLQWKLPCRRLS
jgi:hypothetical protein